MMMNYAIGIDLGGTNIKAVAVQNSGRIVKKLGCPTNAGTSVSWANSVREMVGELEKSIGTKAVAVGIAAPGLAAVDERSIAHMPPGRLDGLQGLDWSRFLKRPGTVPVMNDAHASLLGETWIGAAKGLRNVVLLTLGTGVGGAILSEGRLLRGPHGRAGHLGHICLDVHGPRDIVNTPGSLEFAMGDAYLSERTGGKFSSTLKLVEEHLSGNKEASAFWLKSVHSLACAVCSLINIFDPEMIVIGGGIAQAGKALFQPLREELDSIEWKLRGHEVRLAPALLGNLAGALGAARNGFLHMKNNVLHRKKFHH